MDKPDLSKFYVEVRWHEDMWQTIKNETMTTIGKNKGKYPDSKWKTEILMAEHSPIRMGHIVIKLHNVPSFVIHHLVRHVHITPFVSTFRSDRNDFDEIPNRHTLQDASFDVNFQSFIDMSKKRLCSCASEETRYVWGKVLEAIKPYEPELYNVCVPMCVYRGHCSEMFGCGYDKTDAFKERLSEYRNLIHNEK